MDNGTVESGKEVIYPAGGGFTAFPKRRNRSVLHQKNPNLNINCHGSLKTFTAKKKHANRPSACMLDIFSMR